MNNRVIKILTFLCICASCVNRTENINLVAKVSAVLEVPEMTTAGGVGGAEVASRTYTETGSEAKAKDADKATVSEAVFYIFDENGAFVSRTSLTGTENYSLDFPKSGNYAVYVLCNMSELIDLPETPTRDELESLTIPHCESYDYLPFAGKTVVTVTGDTPTIKIVLSRINSAIRIENRSTDRVELLNATVSGLPSRGNIFDTSNKAAGVTYSESAEAEIDADGNAVVYSFLVPEEQMADVKIEAEAKVKNTASNGENATALAPLSFIDRLEAGKQATALMGYINNDLKIGSPENWGNIGKYELPGGVQLQVVGGEFFDYKNVKGIRASSGGSELSFVVNATEGVASLSTVGSVDWVTVHDNIIVVSQNTGSSERECQIAIAVGGKNIGVFYIVQGKGITFSCTSIPITDNRLEKVGGTGSSSAVYTVTFDISDDELDMMDIVPEDNGANGITVEVNREAKSFSIHFMTLVDASIIGEEGASVPVKFVDANGRVNATLNVTQRPVKITFNPVKYPNISYQGGEVIASVTIEGNSKWNVKSILDKSGNSVGSWLTKIEPASSANSGSNLVLEVAANSTSSSRTAYVLIQSRYTVSKPYVITQAPSYGLKEISANVGWDATTSTLKTYSKGGDYTFTFETETAVPKHITLAVDCDPDGTGSQGITAGEVTNTSGNIYSFTVTVPDSDDTDEEVTSSVNITADGAAIGSFTVRKAYKPSFISVNEEVWGGVKNRPALKKATYRASEWDLKDFTSDNDKLKVTTEYGGDITVSYAETLAYDAVTQTATISMNLNGGNSISYTTRQAPIAFTISETDLAKLKNVVKEGGDIGGITVTTQAGSVGTPWHVVSTSAEWITTSPAAGGPETNASGSTLTVKLSANATGDRTGSFVLESQNTTSPAYDVSQKGAFSATINGVLYNGGSSAVFADGVLKAFSAAYDYTFNISTNNAVEGNRLTVVNKTGGSAVTVKTQPSGTALATTHTFVITVQASTLTTEPESVFDIMADGNRIGGFTVKQAKKPSISVSAATTVGGSSTPVTGSFVASTWDIKSTGYVTSSNATLSIASPSTAGTFSVNMKPSFLQTDAYLNATITLVGVNGNLGTCTIAQNKVVYTFNPTSVSIAAAGGSSAVTVTSSNAGTISSGMTATSSQTSWCTVSVSGNKVTVTATSNEDSNTARSATIYVTYKNSRSQTFTVTQAAGVIYETVTIGGTQWMIYNLANPKQASGGATFATKLPSQCSGVRAESHGKFYQWNINISWNTSSSSASGAAPSGSWQTSNPSGTSWTDTPCPDGFRLPTNAEFTNLINSCNRAYSGTWNASNYGYLTLTDKTNSSNKLEFTAVGRRDNDFSGKLSYGGVYGYYWSSDQVPSNASDAYRMIFNGNSVEASSASEKLRGYSVRCVRQ